MSQLSPALLKEIVEESLKTSEPGKWHITRHAMYTRLAGMLASQDNPAKSALVISESEQIADIMGLASVARSRANYPQANILTLPFADTQFDFVFSDQVLEHVEGSPFAAFRETARVLKPGGYMAHTSCFINEIHKYPKDFWRFTPDALRLMAQEAGCDIVECGGWGNRMVWSYIELGLRRHKIPADPQHPINKLAMMNDPKWPIVTWVVAQKR